MNICKHCGQRIVQPLKLKPREQREVATPAKWVLPTNDFKVDPAPIVLSASFVADFGAFVADVKHDEEKYVLKDPVEWTFSPTPLTPTHSDLVTWPIKDTK